MIDIVTKKVWSMTKTLSNRTSLGFTMRNFSRVGADFFFSRLLRCYGYYPPEMCEIVLKEIIEMETHATSKKIYLIRSAITILLKVYNYKIQTRRLYLINFR